MRNNMKGMSLCNGIYIFPADNGLVTVLKKLSGPLSHVKTHCISGKESARQRGQPLSAGSKQKMGMFGHQCPCMAGDHGL